MFAIVILLFVLSPESFLGSEAAPTGINVTDFQQLHAIVKKDSAPMEDAMDAKSANIFQELLVLFLLFGIYFLALLFVFGIFLRIYKAMRKMYIKVALGNENQSYFGSTDYSSNSSDNGDEMYAIEEALSN